MLPRELHDVDQTLQGHYGAGRIARVTQVQQLAIAPLFGSDAVQVGEETGFRQFVNYQLNQEYLEAYVNALRADYGVKVDNHAVAQIFSDTP